MIERLDPANGRPGRKAHARWIAALAILLTLAHGIRQTQWKGTHNPNDFVTLYAGSFCLKHACDPYSVQDLENVLESKRGTGIVQDWSDQLPIYPPTTLVMLLPLSFLPYSTAMSAWYYSSLLAYMLGLCWLYLASPLRDESRFSMRVLIVLLGAYFPKMMQCLGFGNPSLMVTGLLLFGVSDDGESNKAGRWLALGVACLLKPPLALPLTLLVIFRDSRKFREPFLLLGTLALVMFGLAWCASTAPGMANWRLNLSNNIALGERGGMNPSVRASASNAMLHLAMLPGYFTQNSLIIRMVSLGCVLVLGTVCLFTLFRSRKGTAAGRGVSHLSVATVAALTLLPVYHRFCDIGVLLLVVPWVLYEFAKKPVWRAWVSAAILSLLYFSWERRLPLDGFSGWRLEMLRFFYYRGDALLVLLLSCLLLSALYGLGSDRTRLLAAAS